MVGLLFKWQQAASLKVAKAEFLRINAIKLSGIAFDSKHQDFLKVRRVVLCTQAAKIDRLHLLGKEKILLKGDALHDFFFRALKIKHKQSIINLIKNNEGKKLTNTNDMAMAMLSHLS